MSTFNAIEFGDYLTVTDLGSGAIRVDGCAPGGGGAGIQFNSGTYGADNVGDYLNVETTATNADGYGVTFNTSDGVYMTSVGAGYEQGLTFEIESTDSTAYAIYGEVLADTGVLSEFLHGEAYSEGGMVNCIDAFARSNNGSAQVTGVLSLATANGSSSTAEGVGVDATGQNLLGSGDAIGIKASAYASGSGNEYPIMGYAGSGPTLVFRVDADGSVHVKSGASTSLIADL